MREGEREGGRIKAGDCEEGDMGEGGGEREGGNELSLK